MRRQLYTENLAVNSVLRTLSALAFLLIVGSSRVAYAVDPAPGAACAVNNARTFSGGPELGGIGHWLVCVAGTWTASYTSTATGLMAVGTTGVDSGVRMEVGGGLRLSPGASGAAGFLQLTEILANGTNSVSLRAPNDIASNFSITLPNTSGSAGWSLVNVGNGTLGWTTGGAPSFPLLANPQGSAAAPAYSFSTTTNTGMYSTGVGTLAFSTGGTQAIIVNHLGRVGIGTNDPGERLSVHGGKIWLGDSAMPELQIVGNNSGNSSAYVNFFGRQTGYQGQIAAFGFYNWNGGAQNVGAFEMVRGQGGDNEGDMRFSTRAQADGAVSPRLAITGPGQVGIGALAPTAKLEVVGDIKWAGAGSVGIYPPTAGNYTLRWPNHAGAPGQALITSGTGGILSWGTPVATPSFPLLANPQGTAGAPAYSFSTTTNTGMYSSGVGTLAFSTAGTNAVTINNLGYVGIGATAPVVNLDVRGFTYTNNISVKSFSGYWPNNTGFFGIQDGSNYNSFWLEMSNGEIYKLYASGEGANGFQIETQAGAPLKFNPGGNERMRVGSNGSVGIGTTSPTAKLEVQGDIKWAGAGSVGIYPPVAGNYSLRWPDHAGALGQALITSGTGGILSWGTPIATPSFPLLSTTRGSAGTPAYSFSGDTDTGIFSPAANTLALTTYGTSRIHIANDGSVGIGTNTPVASGLSIHKSTAVESAVEISNSSSTAGLYVGLLGGGEGAVRQQDNQPLTLGTSDLERMRIAANGGVGIGTTAPTARLQVQGDIKWSGAGSVGIYAPTAGNYTLRWPNHAGAAGQALLTSGTGGILSWGAPVAATSFPLLANPQGSAGAPAYSFSNATNAGMYSPGVGTLGFSTSGAQRLTVTPAGSVGIGTSTPTTLFEAPGLNAHNTSGAWSLSFGNYISVPVYSIAFSTGNNNSVGSNRSILIAQENSSIASSVNIVAIGNHQVNTSGTDSGLLFGNNVTVSAATNAVVIGSGVFNSGSSAGNLVNNQANSVWIGSNSSSPSIVVASGSGATPGNVGVGTTAPTSRLQVQGDIKWSGAGSVGIYPPVAGNYSLRWPDHAGALGQALITSGTGGILSWGTPAATPSFPLLSTTRGSVGTPAYSFSGDTDTGIFSPAANTLALTTFGTSRIHIAANGNVGIGLTNPAHPFQVNGYIHVTDVGVTNWGAAATPSIGLFGGGPGMSFPSGTSLVLSTGAAERIRISSNGSVGIGTTAPTARLQVQGDIKWSGAGSVGIYAPTAGNYTLRWPNHAGSAGQALLTSGTGGILSWGAPVAATSFPLLANPQGSAAAPAYSFSTTTNTGMFSTGVGTLALSTAGTQALTVTNLGQVGIGTAAPIDKFHVADGNLAVTGINGGVIRLANGWNDGSYGVFLRGHDNGVNGHDLRIQTRASPSGGVAESVTVTTAGSVGIGTTAPTGVFSVGGPAGANAYLFYDNADVGDGNDGQSLYIYRRAAEGDNSIRMRIDQWQSAHVDVDAHLFFNNITDYRNANFTGTWPEAYNATEGARAGPRAHSLGIFNNSAVDGSAAGIHLNARNAANSWPYQEAHIYAVSTTSGYAPHLVFGRRTGSNSYGEAMRINSGGSLGIGTTAPTATLTVNGSFARNITTTTAATYTVSATDTHIIANRAGTVTLTLPAAASFAGREISVRTIQGQTVVSASSNVVPMAGGAAGTAILAATAGRWALLVSDGTNWQIQMGN